METRAATELKMDYFPLASVVAMNSLNVSVLGEARLFSGFFRVGSFVLFNISFESILRIHFQVKDKNVS